MTIENLTPLPRSTIGAGDSISFSVANTYTQMDIQETRDVGGSIYTTAGGPQSGYTVKVVESGSTHVVTVKRTDGWDQNPTILQVTEDQDTDVTISVFSYDLPRAVRFPPQINPANVDFVKVRVSEDDGVPIEDVSHIDVVSGTPPDGMTATSAGPPDAEIVASAATTDPDAIHDNEANEISTITEKGTLVGGDPTILDDWVVIEDSADSYAKKRMTVETLVGYSSPTKLGTEYSPELLYLFEDRLDIPNEGSLTDTQLDFAHFSCRETVYDDKVGQQKGMFCSNDGSSELQTVNLTSPPASLQTGECTAQAIIRIGGDSFPFRFNETFANKGATMFSFKQQNAARTNVCWGLFLEHDGVDDTHYVASFDYTDSLSSGLYTCRDTNTCLIDYGTYILQGRRQSDGAGTYTTSIWVNGLKVQENTLQPAPYASAWANSHRVVHWTDGGNDGLERISIFASKYNSSALTDDQLNSEYKKALGYV